MGYISDYGKGMVINMSFLKEEQFAAMNLIYSRCKMDYFLDSIQRLGICNIELWTQIPYFCELDQSLCNLTNIRRRLAIRNLHLICLIPEQCSWPFNIASDDPEIRRSSVDFYRRHFEMAAALEVDKVLLTPGWYPWDKPVEEGLKYSEDSLHQLLPQAKKYGLTPVLEILQPCESNLMYNLAGTQWYADRFEAGELSFCIDTVPVRLAGEKLSDYFELLGDRLRHVHLIDGTPTGHMALGDGSHPIREYLDTMEKFSYGGFITLEFGSDIYMGSPEVHMKRGWNYLQRMLAACS